MAARFHSPHPSRRGHSVHLALVPAPLAAVLPLPVSGRQSRPEGPARPVLLICRPCELTAGPMPAAKAEQAAGAHDDLRHGGVPTATLRTVPGPRPTARTETVSFGDPAGPDLGGAA